MHERCIAWGSVSQRCRPEGVERLALHHARPRLNQRLLKQGRPHRASTKLAGWAQLIQRFQTPTACMPPPTQRAVEAVPVGRDLVDGQAQGAQRAAHRLLLLHPEAVVCVRQLSGDARLALRLGRTWGVGGGALPGNAMPSMAPPRALPEAVSQNPPTIIHQSVWPQFIRLGRHFVGTAPMRMPMHAWTCIGWTST